MVSLGECCMTSQKMAAKETSSLPDQSIQLCTCKHFMQPLLIANSYKQGLDSSTTELGDFSSVVLSSLAASLIF